MRNNIALKAYSSTSHLRIYPSYHYKNIIHTKYKSDINIVFELKKVKFIDRYHIKETHIANIKILRIKNMFLILEFKKY